MVTEIFKAMTEDTSQVARFISCGGSLGVKNAIFEENKKETR